MKRLFGIVAITVLLSGCGSNDADLSDACRDFIDDQQQLLDKDRRTATIFLDGEEVSMTDRQAIADDLRRLDGAEMVRIVTTQEAYERAKELSPEVSDLPGAATAFPASIEVDFEDEVDRTGVDEVLKPFEKGVTFRSASSERQQAIDDLRDGRSGRNCHNAKNEDDS